MRFDPNAIPSDVRRIASLLEGWSVYPVGGIVRDSVREALLRGEDLVTQVASGDWDLTTSATPDVVMERLRAAGIATVDVGIDHGTVVARLGPHSYEITSFRADVKTDGRHAQVEFGCSLEEDIKRRDFTVNALALDLHSLGVIDLCGGIDDLRTPIIRCVGDPFLRFTEDRLRLIRAIRFATHLSAEIERGAWNAMIEASSRIKEVSAERIRDELQKILSAPKPSHGFRLMKECGLLREVLPELDACFGVAQNKHHSHDVGEHTLLCVDALPARYPFLRFVALLHDMAKPIAKLYLPDRDDYVFYGHEKIGADMAVEVLRRLRFSNQEIERARLLIAEHMFRLTEPSLGKKGLRRFLRRLGRESLEDYIRMRVADRAGNLAWEGTREPGLWNAIKGMKEILRDEEALHVKDLAIGGDDLIAMGLSPGPEFSRILNALLERVLDEPSLNDREDLLRLARSLSS